eukprot:403369611
MNNLQPTISFDFLPQNFGGLGQPQSNIFYANGIDQETLDEQKELIDICKKLGLSATQSFQNPSFLGPSESCISVRNFEAQVFPAFDNNPLMNAQFNSQVMQYYTIKEECNMQEENSTQSSAFPIFNSERESINESSFGPVLNMEVPIGQEYSIPDNFYQFNPVQPQNQPLNKRDAKLAYKSKKSAVASNQIDHNQSDQRFQFEELKIEQSFSKSHSNKRRAPKTSLKTNQLQKKIKVEAPADCSTAQDKLKSKLIFVEDKAKAKEAQTAARIQKTQQREKQKKNSSPIQISNNDDSYISYTQDQTQTFTSTEEKLKLDQAYKMFLRGIRKAITKYFRSLEEFSNGHYHWDEQTWWNKAELFLIKYAGFINPTPKEIAAIVITLYKNFGPKRTATGKIIFVENMFTKVLGQDLSILYKITYDFNSNSTIQQFFNDTFIQKIWHLTQFAEDKDFFQKKDKQTNEYKPNLACTKIPKSLQQLSYDVNKLGFLMPACWFMRYPAYNHKKDSQIAKQLKACRPRKH